jgi:hypothetical protein
VCGHFFDAKTANKMELLRDVTPFFSVFYLSPVSHFFSFPSPLSFRLCPLLCFLFVFLFFDAKTANKIELLRDVTPL